MPGSFPLVPPPDPEDENASHMEYIEEIPHDPFVDEQAEPNQAGTQLEEQAISAPLPTTELPPEAQGEANGGPLGCCLGIMVGVMLSLFLGVIGLGHLAANVLVSLFHADAITNIRLATGFFVIIGIILGGYLGWKIGKRIYREYELSARQKRKLEELERKYKARSKEARS